MSIATRLKDYYSHEDFKGNYADYLHTTFAENEGDIVNRIISLFNVSNYETEKYLTNHFIIDREQSIKIFAFIEDNLEEFTKDFNGYYVGYTSLESISFGEQEEQLTGIYNPKTGKDYSLKYMQKVCEDEGYFINGDYAYYNLDGGLHVDLLGNIELLNEFLLTIK